MCVFKALQQLMGGEQAGQAMGGPEERKRGWSWSGGGGDGERARCLSDI